MKIKKLPIGIADFREMVTGNYYYVDKTLFIKEIIDSGDKILLIPRPRRFGKTLNLSMLGYFYNCCPASWAPDFDSAEPVPAVSPMRVPKHFPRRLPPGIYSIPWLSVKPTRNTWIK